MSGITTWLVLSAEESQMRAALFWLQGSLAGPDWPDLGLPAAVVVISVVTLIGWARPLNALVMGDETAASLGIDIERLRRRLFVLSSLVVAVLGGAVRGDRVRRPGRPARRAAHRRRPGELPVGVVTSIIGGPAFLWLLRGRNQEGRPA
ncbi:MAG: iron chelate uptake ABC transporter family permease subunit [Egibacteraceae bacterium]